MNKKELVITKYSKYIRDVPDFPKPGIIFKDITPVFEAPEFANLVLESMIEELKNNNIEFDKIICPEARGFLFGIPLGLMLNKPVVLARKPGKLPKPGQSITFDIEYGQDTLVVSEDSIKEDEKILIVDDLLATGGSCKALNQLVESANAKVAGDLIFLELTPLRGREKLEPYPVITIVPIEAY